MKVYMTDRSQQGLFAKWFPDGASLITSRNNIPDDVDLLIIPGGADIAPMKYGEEPEGSYGCEPDRDSTEFSILERVLSHNRTVKVLGVCRGAQLINVFFGGSLYQELRRYDKAHPALHKLEYLAETDLNWLVNVNSMHHQGLKRIPSNGTVVAIEPRSEIAEMTVFDNRFLAVQYHPEFFNDDLGGHFFSVINGWVGGNKMVKKVPEEKKVSRPSINKLNYEKYLGTFNIMEGTNVD